MQHLDRSSARTKPARDVKAVAEPMKLCSVAVARLIEEVRVGNETKLDAYNRTYHRHNR